MDNRKPRFPPTTSAASNRPRISYSDVTRATNSSIQNTETDKKTLPEGQRPEAVVQTVHTQVPRRHLPEGLKPKANSLTGRKISPTQSKSNLQAAHPRKSPRNLNAVLPSEPKSTFTVFKSTVKPRRRLESCNSSGISQTSFLSQPKDIPATKTIISTTDNVEQEDIRNEIPLPSNQTNIDENFPIMKDPSTCLEQVKPDEPKVNKKEPEVSESILPQVNKNEIVESLPKVNENKPEEFDNIVPDVIKNEDSDGIIEKVEPEASFSISQAETQTDQIYDNQKYNPENYHADTSYFTEDEINELVKIFGRDVNITQQAEIKPEIIHDNPSTNQESFLYNKTSNSTKLSLPDKTPFYNQCNHPFYASTCKEKTIRSKKSSFSNKSSNSKEASLPNKSSNSKKSLLPNKDTNSKGSPLTTKTSYSKRLPIPNKTPYPKKSSIAKVCSLPNNASASNKSSKFTGSSLPDKVSTFNGPTQPKNKTTNHKPLTFSIILQSFDEETQKSIPGPSTSAGPSGSTTTPRCTDLHINWCDEFESDEDEISNIVNLLEAGTCNILDDAVNLTENYDSSPKVDNRKLETPLTRTDNQNEYSNEELSTSFDNLTTKYSFSTIECLRSLEKMIAGLAFNNLPESIAENIPESSRRSHPEPRDLDFGATINTNKGEPPCMTEDEAHKYMSGDFSGYFNFPGHSSENPDSEDLPLPHIATETIDRLEKLLEMILAFGFKITEELEDHFGNQILAPPVNNSITMIRDALKPLKSHLETAKDTAFFRPFMNIVNDAIAPAFHHINDMRLTLQSPRTYENHTQMVLENDEVNETDETSDVSSVNQEVNNENYVIDQENAENQTTQQQSIQPPFLPFPPNMPPFLPLMPNNIFQSFPIGYFGFNPNQPLMLPYQNVENYMMGPETQYPQSLVPMPNTVMVYHNPMPRFNNARVLPFGLIEFQFKHDLQVVLTSDLSLIVINRATQVVATLSSDSRMAGLKFLYAECQLEGKTINVGISNQNYVVDKRAKIWEKGISFQDETSPMSYLLTEAGIATSICNFPCLPSDFIAQIFYKSGKHGKSYAQRCIELLNSCKYEIHADGSSCWFIRNMKISQNTKGQVVVHKANFAYSIFMSPLHKAKPLNKNLRMYTARIQAPNMMLTCSATIDADDEDYRHHLFIKQGHKKELFTNNNKFAVRNGSQVAGLNMKTHKIQLNPREFS